MDSRSILYGPGRNDECMTPEYAVHPIAPYVMVYKTIWCPFDTEDSFFVRVLRQYGCNVIASHKSTGQDFYTYEPPQWDCIVSNPPFTNKRKIFERALSFNKPFALLMSIVWLNDKAPTDIFRKARADMQLMLFDRRIEYLNSDGTPIRRTRPGDRITFSSAYFCRDVLPRDIVSHQANW